MKPPIPIYLAVEDDLSEWVPRRLLDDRPVEYFVNAVFKRSGFGYLKKQALAFNNMAKASPVLLLTDLDHCACAPALLEDWLAQPKHSDFLFRIAVREVEAWLLGSDCFGQFLGIRRQCTFADPKTLPDPKAELLKLALTSTRRDLRESIVRRDQNGILRQGPAYNSTLAVFVNSHWQPAEVARKCRSLHRVLAALASLEARWQNRRA